MTDSHARPPASGAGPAATPAGPAVWPAGQASASRRRVAARTRVDFWFDAALLISFTLAYSYRFTGITLGLVPVHVALRWRWLVAVARRLARRRRPAREPG